MENQTESVVWGIHSQDDSLFLDKSIIGIGWTKMGDLSKIGSTRENFKEKVQEVYPDIKKGAIPNWAGIMYRFVVEMKKGDYIVFPSKADRKINLGIIESDYMYDELAPLYPNIRKVKWLKHYPRRTFSQGALYEVGSLMTLFTIKNYANEYLGSLDKKFSPKIVENTEDETVGVTAEDIMNNTRDYILKEISRQFKGYDLENFVASLLNAMGYRTTVSPHGGDSSIDIIAYKDELPPRIAVQVKSQDGDMKETTIQSLKGAMMPGDYGLFVSLSDYTKSAKKFLKANPIIRGINGIELVNLVLKYYEGLDETYQRAIPLKKVYIPVAKGEDKV